jgi:hypothetical protein
MARRRAFKAVQKKHALSPEALEACRMEIAQSRAAIDDVAAQVASKVEKYRGAGLAAFAQHFCLELRGICAHSGALSGFARVHSNPLVDTMLAVAG